MKIIFDSKEKSIIKFEKGDKCFSLFTELAKERDTSFYFTMIGGCSAVELAFFDMNEKKYITKTFTPGFSKNIEVIHISGNMTWFEDKPVIHAHGVFSNEEYKCFGGHIMKIQISITGETVVNWLPKKLERDYDAEMCLKLLKEK